MSEIPEDVMKVAREVVAQRFDKLMAVHAAEVIRCGSFDDEHPDIKRVASAIMAERERCVSILCKADPWLNYAADMQSRLSSRPRTEVFMPGSLAPELMRRSEEALREGSLPWRPMTSLDLHEAYEAHGPYCALMFHDGHFAMPCDPHTLLDQDIEGTLWVTVDEIPPPRAALQGRDGDVDV